MSIDAITVAVGSLAVSTVSLAVSGINAWLTLWRRGTVRMAQPPTLYFGPDGARELHPKIFVRCFLYSTSVRSRCVESMFARVRRGDSSQTFPVWVCGGARDDLSRGAGLAVGADGVALHHHFLLPRDGTTYKVTHRRLTSFCALAECATCSSPPGSPPTPVPSLCTKGPACTNAGPLVFSCAGRI